MQLLSVSQIYEHITMELFELAKRNQQTLSDEGSPIMNE